MSAKRYDILTYFDTCVDIVADMGDCVPEFGQKEQLIPSIDVMLGGSACIFACQCAKLGLRASGAGVVGADPFGALVKGQLAQCGVDTSLIAESAHTSTSAGILLCRDADRAILTADPSIRALRADALPETALSSARHLHVASYYLLSGVNEGLPAVLATAKKNGLTVSLDTNWDPAERWELPDDVLRHVDMLFVNENEARGLSGRAGLDAAAAHLLRRVPMAVIKTGARGAVLYAQGCVLRKPALDVPVKDTVGAGDSFDAGFLYGFLGGLSLEESLRCALFCGSMNVRGRGGTAGQATLPELTAYLNGPTAF